MAISIIMINEINNYPPILLVKLIKCYLMYSVIHSFDGRTCSVIGSSLGIYNRAISSIVAVPQSIWLPGLRTAVGLEIGQ